MTSAPSAPPVQSPAQRAEQARLGLRYSGIAALGGLVCLVVIAPYVGAPLGWWAIKKAREHGNPATVGVIVLVLNSIALVAMVLIAVRVLMSA